MTSPSSPIPSITIRPETATDIPRIAEVVAAAFGDEPVAPLVGRIRSSPGYRPDLSLVAELDGEIVGHVMVSDATLDDTTIAMLSPLAVDPRSQRRGIGGELVRAVAALADTRGDAFIVLEGSPDYYGRLGFEPAARYGITMPIPDWAPPEAAQLLPLSGFDADNAPRGLVVYPPAFDELD